MLSQMAWSLSARDIQDPISCMCTGCWGSCLFYSNICCSLAGCQAPFKRAGTLLLKQIASASALSSPQFKWRQPHSFCRSAPAWPASVHEDGDNAMLCCVMHLRLSAALSQHAAAPDLRNFGHQHGWLTSCYVLPCILASDNLSLSAYDTDVAFHVACHDHWSPAIMSSCSLAFHGNFGP